MAQLIAVVFASQDERACPCANCGKAVLHLYNVGSCFGSLEAKRSSARQVGQKQYLARHLATAVTEGH